MRARSDDEANIPAQSVSLPPSLEKALQEAFTKGALISEPDAARIIGFSTATLRREAARGKIETVQRGARRAYTIEALRAYLAPAIPPEPSPPQGTSNVSGRRFSSASVEAHEASLRLEALAAKLRVKKRQAYARPGEDNDEGQ